MKSKQTTMRHSRTRLLAVLLALKLASGLRYATSALAAAGDPDPTFDGDGQATTDLGSGDSAQDVAVLEGGKIVVAGISAGTNHDFVLVRYNPDGSPDTSFGSNGKSTRNLGPGRGDSARDLVLQPDSEVVAAGFSKKWSTSGATSEENFALVRYGAANADTTAPTVEGVTAPRKRGANATVLFSEPMDPATLMEDPDAQSSASETVVLLRGGATSTTRVSAKVSCAEASCETVVLDPGKRLAKRTKYTVRIEGSGDADGLAVADLSANELAEDYFESFKTRDR